MGGVSEGEGKGFADLDGLEAEGRGGDWDGKIYFEEVRGGDGEFERGGRGGWVLRGISWG